MKNPFKPQNSDGVLVFEVLWPEGRTEFIDNNQIVHMGDIIKLGGLIKSVSINGVQIAPGEGK